MKYWSDDTETYAATSLKDVAAEQYKAGMIGDYSFNQDEWSPVSPWKKAWICELGDAIHEIKRGKVWELIAKIKWYRPIWWIFIFHRSPSCTKKAWLICSTEY